MRILGWVLFAAACGFFVLQGVFLAASDYSMTSYEVVIDHVFPLLGLGAIVGAGVGALIVSRYPRNLVGWLFLIGQLGNAVGLAADAFGALVRQGIVEAPMAGRIAAFLTQFSGTVFTVCVMAVIFMIVPDGHLLSRRWRVAAAVPVLSMLLWWTGGILAPAGMGMPGATGEPGLREGLGEVLIAAGFLATLLSICLGAVALVLRLRRSTGLEHLRLRWIATGAAALAVTFVLFALSDLILEGTPWILTIATCLAYALFPVSVGVAIFRYRLFDIDVILNRAVVLGLLVVFVTIGYIAVVVAIGAVLRGIGAPGSVLYWPSLVATALVAAAFQPLRGRVLRLADRLVYGQRAVPYEALASLSRRLADSPAPDGAPARVAEAAGRAVGAAAVTVRLGRPDEPVPVRAAAWSDTAGTTGSARVEAAGLVLPCTTWASRSDVSKSPCPAARPCGRLSGACSRTWRHKPVSLFAMHYWRPSWPDTCGRAWPSRPTSRHPEDDWSVSRTRHASVWQTRSNAGWSHIWSPWTPSSAAASRPSATGPSDWTHSSPKSSVPWRNSGRCATGCSRLCCGDAGWCRPCPPNWTAPIHTPGSWSTTRPCRGSPRRWRLRATCSAWRSHPATMNRRLHGECATQRPRDHGVRRHSGRPCDNEATPGSLGLRIVMGGTG